MTDVERPDSIPQNQPQRIVRIPEAILFDVDRCSLDTVKTFGVAVEAAAYNTPITGPSLYDAYKRHAQNKLPLNLVGHINNELEGTGYTWKDHIEPDFIEKGRRLDLLMKGARTVIDYAQQAELFLAMFTYGSSSPLRNDQKWEDAKAWQLAKIAAGGLDDLPSYVCNRKEKGAKIAGWHRSDEGFYLPDSMSTEPGIQVIARRVVLIDDRTDSFDGMNEFMYGIRVNPEGEANQMEYQSGELPSGVVTVHGMTEALGALKTFVMLGRAHG